MSKTKQFMFKSGVTFQLQDLSTGQTEHQKHALDVSSADLCCIEATTGVCICIALRHKTMAQMEMVSGSLGEQDSLAALD